MKLLLALVALTLEHVAAHSAITIPRSRNAIDSDLKPWGGAVPHPLPFEPWCPMPSQAMHLWASCPGWECGVGAGGLCDPANSALRQAAAGIDDRNLTGANGQSCFWFSNGCAIGCKACDGSTRGLRCPLRCHSPH